MATVASVHTAMSVQIQLEGWTHQVLSSMLKREAIVAGQTAVHILPSFAGFEEVNSNEFYDVGHYTITFAHKLLTSSNAAELTYVTSSLPTYQAVVMAKSWYRALTGVRDVKEAPALTPAERIGNIIEWAVDVQLVIKP